MLDALSFAFETEGYEVRAFANAETLLASDVPRGSLCFVLDQRMLGMSGLTLLAALRAQAISAPLEARAHFRISVAKKLSRSALLHRVSRSRPRC